MRFKYMSGTSEGIEAPGIQGLYKPTAACGQQAAVDVVLPDSGDYFGVSISGAMSL